ncbi:MAG TPA: efflux RND transporter periplasmic adaptor subunit [Bryobacteraceae bacterium]|nr:efflux RND transporter periplasmic adaptor subunit [Bryobacteraceae bacterium]
MKKLLLVLLLGISGVIVWGILRRSAPPQVTCARVRRETLVSTLPTNGKVEPFEWQAVRAESAGVVGSVGVVDGRPVTKGALLAQITDPSLQAQIDAAAAKVNEMQADLASLEAAVKPAELTDIENGLARANLDLQQAQREHATLQRLADKHAATPADVRAAADRIQQLQTQIAGLERRRHTVTPPADIDAARARLQDAQVALKLAQQQAALSEVRAPMAGVIYGLAVRPGTYVKPGDLVANIGIMDRLRVRVYIDEPELGRVALGQPVTITWQALPGKQWQGAVERKPIAIESFGSRQVGEVVCSIENPERQLIPGTNVDALIRTAVVDGALVIPKEALRHDAAGDFVFVLKSDAIERRPVKTGNSSVTRIQVTDGLAENDAVTLPSDTSLKPGDRVTPVFGGAS